jgi:hypothetical protein
MFQMVSLSLMVEQWSSKPEVTGSSPVGIVFSYFFMRLVSSTDIV